MINNKFLYLLVMIFLIISPNLFAQRIVQRGLDEQLKGVIYKKEWSLEFTLHHDGFLVGYNWGKIKSFRKTSYYHVDFGCIRDAREVRQNKNYGELGLSKSFAYGKQNAFFQFRFAKGAKHYLSEKYNIRGVALAYSYRFGPSFGLLKPVYLSFYKFEDSMLDPNLESIKYNEENAEMFMNYDRIYGGSGFNKGIGEVKIVPGFHGNIAFHFAKGAYGKYVRALELGLMGDIFIRKVPIMVETELINNKPYFLKLYVNLQFGARSN